MAMRMIFGVVPSSSVFVVNKAMYPGTAGISVEK